MADRRARVAGENVYFGTYEETRGTNYLYSLDWRTGELNRQYATPGGVLADPVISRGYAYIVSGEETLYAVDLLTGRR